MNEHARIVCDFLRSVGAENVRLGRGGKHPRVLFEWKGEERFHTMPGTPGDTIRGPKNAIAELRHDLGLTEPVKRVGERRVRKDRASKPVAARPVLSSLHDGLAALSSHAAFRTVLKHRESEAWRAWWRAFMGEESRL